MCKETEVEISWWGEESPRWEDAEKDTITLLQLQLLVVQDHILAQAAHSRNSERKESERKKESQSNEREHIQKTLPTLLQNPAKLCRAEKSLAPTVAAAAAHDGS